MLHPIVTYSGPEELSICVMTPCGSGSPPMEFVTSLVNMIAFSWLNGLRIYQIINTSRMVVDWARNELARTAIEHKCEYTGQYFTHILWLDDDMVFQPDLALRLLKRPNLDMVSGLYFGRGTPLPVVFVKRPEDKSRHIHHNIADVPHALVEIDACGFGALMMRRDVLERVPEPWFTIDWQAGEDIAFCVKAKENGIRIWCDGTVILGHIGNRVIVGQGDHERFMAEHGNDEKFQVTLMGIKD